LFYRFHTFFVSHIFCISYSTWCILLFYYRLKTRQIVRVKKHRGTTVKCQTTVIIISNDLFFRKHRSFYILNIIMYIYYTYTFYRVIHQLLCSPLFNSIIVNLFKLRFLMHLDIFNDHIFRFLRYFCTT